MVDVTIVGGGTRALDCAAVLSRAGFSAGHSFDVEAGERSPIILGDVPGAFQMAREAIDAGRHLLIAAQNVLTPERLTLLLEHRGPGQALFVWSDRRYHPGYRFVSALMESDSTWRPRYIRQETLSTEQPASALFRWRTLEAIALLNSITGGAAKTVTATAVLNAKRNAPDLASLVISYPDIQAQLVVGLGEAIERRETLIASASRKAYVDELDPSMPMRIVDDDPATAKKARQVSCAAPSSAELARQQCIAFLDGTLQVQHAADETVLWTHSLATLASMEQSLASRTPAQVLLRQDESRFRMVTGMRESPPSVA